MQCIFAQYDPWADPFMQWVMLLMGVLVLGGLIAVAADTFSERNKLKLAQINLENTLAIAKITDPEVKTELLRQSLKQQKEAEDDD